MFIKIRYRRLPEGKLTGRNKDIVLECPRIGEYAGYSEECWDLLKSIGMDQSLPWLVCGDFNEILYSFEKVGGLPQDEHKMERFGKILEECCLVDVGYSRPPNIWDRGNLPETNIHERSDRGVANAAWEVKNIGESNTSSVLEKLEVVKSSLKLWERGIKEKRAESSKQLHTELSRLVQLDRDAENLAELIGVKLHLNLEIDKEEAYWEQVLEQIG
ncbi:hypothetical protein CXB51_003050 [Gossypium anomalum]|uniref:Endonuclease/exonuclease/phosphatase domain-containing protein n=1 Tax=Gossypium anomalum TaxID=47600 RepID=A0A8J5ZGN4_9ROSI|nr:hypothetical protein CXB51_003050 [Gossypium anomalum]